VIGEAGLPAPRPPATSVAFGARRRPEDATEVRLPEWEGPLGLLLALVEARRLDVLSVPLGDLAEAYLDALATLDGDRLGSISAFVAVASQLILFKSRAMLPRPPAPGAAPADDGPDPEAELRARSSTAPSATPARRSRHARSTVRSSSVASRAWRRRPAKRKASRRTRPGWTSRSWSRRSTGWRP
jgi:chromatin segregation and condensation protein Rec8/ScpA/Scc1 (kleisin family)